LRCSLIDANSTQRFGSRRVLLATVAASEEISLQEHCYRPIIYEGNR
jgi:hypothetical protein